jgi:thiol:disulfide interchange protein DsbD
MRKLFFTVAFLALPCKFSNAGSCKWTTKIEKKSDNTYLLTFDGVIEKIGICTPSLLLTEGH